MELLTQRQQQVLACIALGLSPHEIADKLCVSKRTVDFHLACARLRLRREHSPEDMANTIQLMHIVGLWAMPVQQIREIAKVETLACAA